MGCSGVAAQGHNPNQRKAPTTIAEALKRGEESGVLPKLDRSASIAGPDADGNGVRDDLDAYIDSLPDTPEQKKALKQDARHYMTLLTVNVSDKNAVHQAFQMGMDSSKCVFSKYDAAVAGNKVGNMEKLSINTKERLGAYMKFNAAISGTSATLPNGDGCAE